MQTERAFIVARLEFDGSDVKLVGANLFSEPDPSMTGLTTAVQVVVLTGWGESYVEGIENIKKTIHSVPGWPAFFSSLLSRCDQQTLESLGLEEPKAQVAADLLKEQGFEEQAESVLALPRLEMKIDDVLSMLRHAEDRYLRQRRDRSQQQAATTTTTAGIFEPPF